MGSTHAASDGEQDPPHSTQLQMRSESPSNFSLLKDTYTETLRFSLSFKILQFLYCFPSLSFYCIVRSRSLTKPNAVHKPFLEIWYHSVVEKLLLLLN